MLGSKLRQGSMVRKPEAKAICPMCKLNTIMVVSIKNTEIDDWYYECNNCFYSSFNLPKND